MHLHYRYCLLLVLLCCAVSVQCHKGHGDHARLTVSIIDVGEGDATLVQFPNGQTMLVDAGDPDHAQIVVDYLRSRQIFFLDVLVCSHPHPDHIGGMEAVLNAFPVGVIWSSGFIQPYCHMQQSLLKAIQARKLPQCVMHAGVNVRIGETLVEVLAPTQVVANTESDANNNCLVLRISYGNISFLLTGDMQAEERTTLAAWPQSTVVKVAHHGANNGTDLAFAQAVSPQYAVISVAKQNHFCFPQHETMLAWQSVNAKIVQTAESGTLIFTTNGHHINMSTLSTGEFLLARRAARTRSPSRRLRANVRV